MFNSKHNWEDPCDASKQKTIFTLTSNFSIQSLILTLKMPIFMIHNFSRYEIICDPIQRPKCIWIWELFFTRLSTLIEVEGAKFQPFLKAFPMDAS
jgi:hypothetical protein